MGEFRIGRRFAQHSYPEARRNTTVPLARNYAMGPKEGAVVDDNAVQIWWAEIDSVSEWSDTTTYSEGDIVSSLGATWISLQDNNTNNTPSGSPLFWAENTVIPITPSSSGVVIVHGIVQFENDAPLNPIELIVTVLVDGVPLATPPSFSAYVNDTILEAEVPVLIEVKDLPLGVRADISIEVVASAASVTIEALTVAFEVREMQPATG